MSHSIDEIYSVYHEQFVCARKEHTCSACQEKISKGTRYTKVRIVFDGRANSIKRCFRCQQIHEHLRELDPGELWPDERLDCGLDYEEEWGKPPSIELQELAFIFPDEKPGTLIEKIGVQ